MKRLNLRLISILVVTVLVAGVGVFLLQRYQVNSHARGLLRRADLAVEEGDLPKAIAHLSRYVQQRPDDTAAFKRMALLQEQTTQDRVIQPQEFAATWRLLEKAIRLEPDDAELRKRTAEFYLRCGRSKDAIAHLQALQSKTDDPQTQMLLAQAYVRSANFKDSAAILEKMVGYSSVDDAFSQQRAVDPANIEAHALLAEIHLDQHANAELAERVMDAAVEANPQSAAAHLARGRLRLKRARLAGGATADSPQIENAIADIRAAAELSPDDAEVISAMVDVEISEGNLDAAKSRLEHGLKLHPDRESFYRSRAGIALREKRTDEAFAIIEKGLQVLPDSWPLLLMQAELDLAAGNLARMRETAERLRRDDRLHVLGDYLNAQALLAESKWKAGSEQLVRLLPELMARRPDLGPQVYTALAQCYERMGQTDQQREANRQLLELEPASLAGHFSEARALTRLGRLAEARRELAIAQRIAQQRGLDVADLNKWEITLLAAQQRVNPEDATDAAELERRFLEQVAAREGISEEQQSAIHVRYLMQQNEIPRAAEILEAALSDSPESEDLLLAQVDLVQLRDGSQRAAELLTKLEQSHGDAVDLRLRRALLIAESPTEDTAEQLQALEQNTTGFTPAEVQRLLHGLATIQRNRNQPREALRLWRRIANSDPDQLPIRLRIFELATALRDEETMAQTAEEIRSIAGENSAYAKFVTAHQRLALAEGELSAAQLHDIRQLVRQAQADRPQWHALSLLHADLDLREGNVNAAIDHLMAALEQGPAAPPAVRKLVELLWSQRRYDEARDVIGRLGPASTGDALGARVQSRLDLADGELASAIESARVSAEDSDNPADHIWLGQLLARDRQMPQAIAAYRRALALAPRDEQARLLLLRTLLLDGRRDEAEAEVRAIALDADPQRADSMLGIAYELLGETLLAKRHFEQALLARPRDPLALRDLAAFYLLTGDNDAAMAHVDRLLALEDSENTDAEPLLLWARREKARLIGATGRYSDFQTAVALLEKNAADDVMSSADLLLVAELTLPRDDPYALRRVIGRFEQAQESRTLTASERLALGRLQFAAGAWPKCEEIMTALVADESDNAPIISAWCEMQLRHGQTRNVAALLRQLPSESPATKRLRARLLAMTDQKERALDVVRSLAPPAEAENRLAAVLSLARFLEELKLYDEAGRYFTAVAKQQAGLRFELADFYARTGKLDAAFDLCDTSLGEDNVIAITRIGIVGLTAARGKITADSPQFQRVADWVTQGLRDLPDSKVLLLHHAFLKELEGDHQTAAQLYKQYLARADLDFRERAVAANNLAMLQASTGDCSAAKLHIDEAIALVGPVAAMLDTRAMVGLCAGDPADIELAVEELRLARAVTNEPVIGFHLALALETSGDRAAARQAIEDALGDGLDPAELSALDRARYDELAKSLGIETS